MGRPWALLTAGIAIVGVGLSYLFSYIGFSNDGEILPLAAVILGIWLLIQGAVKRILPVLEETDGNITAGWGIMILALGLVGDLAARGYPLPILLVGFTILVGALVILPALTIWLRTRPSERSERQAKQHKQLNYLQMF
jgi:hypothetical protein